MEKKPNLYKRWKANGHICEIKPELFVVDEAGNQNWGLKGTMDGKVMHWTMNIFQADLKTLLEIEYYLDLHAWGKWPFSSKQK